MPVNAHPEYISAERDYDQAITSEEKIKCLERMISFAPSHKGGENLRSQLKTRYKKLVESLEKAKKSGKSTQQGIKKAEMQSILIGPPNSGKSNLFKKLTNQDISIVDHPYSTFEPILGTIYHEDVKIQIIDTPSFPNTDKGLIHTTDTILLIVDKIEDIKNSEEYLKSASKKTKLILVITKIDLLNDLEKRKLEATLKSKYKKFEYLLIGDKTTPEEIKEIKKKIFKSFPIIRVYTKEPKKEHSKEPMILKEGSRLIDVAGKISRSLKDKIKFAKIWGPSSKFQGQTIGPNHILKDKDIVELKID
jgi:uncharacterized protein